jgi:K+-transporting ATPase ATPase C chain
MNARKLVSSVLVSLRFVVATSLAFGALYPLAVLLPGRLIAPHAADGSLIRDDAGRVIGSELLAQSFTRPEWFWSRPSAVAYNASATGGTNLAPTNPALSKRVQDAIAAHVAAGDEVGPARPIPPDLVLASGGGLDPDITIAAARFQIPRVARARGLSIERVTALVEAHAAGTAASTLTGARPTVNVLRLNLALARLARTETRSAWTP